jgi:Cu/Ag efflux protein CusF
MKHQRLVIFLLAALISSGACAQAAHDHGNHGTPPATATPQALTAAEVRKVDKPAGKLTLKHGAIKNLDMEPMTMVFRVADASMLDQFKAGDKVNFAAEKIGGQLTVTRIEKAQ